MRVVLSGRRGGSTHREVELLGSLPPELRLIGGLAVMCRVGTPHRTTVDIDALARGLDRYHEAISRLALTSVGGGQYTFAGDLDLDVIDVAGVGADDLVTDLLAAGDPGAELSDLELNVVAHTWAHDHATALDLAAADEDSGEILARANDRLVATSLGLVAMKATTVSLRASSKPEKRASDLYDLGRLLVDGGLVRGEADQLPPSLNEAVSVNLHRWFVDPRGSDRTFREVRRFDEPRLDLDEVADAVVDLGGSIP